MITRLRQTKNMTPPPPPHAQTEYTPPLLPVSGVLRSRPCRKPSKSMCGLIKQALQNRGVNAKCSHIQGLPNRPEALIVGTSKKPPRGTLERGGKGQVEKTTNICSDEGRVEDSTSVFSGHSNNSTSTVGLGDRAAGRACGDPAEPLIQRSSRTTHRAVVDHPRRLHVVTEETKLPAVPHARCGKKMYRKKTGNATRGRKRECSDSFVPSSSYLGEAAGYLSFAPGSE